MKTKRILPLLLVCILSVAGMFYALTRPQTTFVPPPFESDAVEGVPQELAEEWEYAILDAGAYTVGLCGIPVQSGEKLTLCLTNPASNAVWMKVRVCTPTGKVLGESGLLRPGQYVREITLEQMPEDTEIALKVMAYEPDTYRSAGAVTLHTKLIIR